MERNTILQEWRRIIIKKEREHLEQCQGLIKRNIQHYEEQSGALRGQTRELFAAVTSGNSELYDQLIVAQKVQEHSESQLRKNKTALEKPYFGRIDYLEVKENLEEQLYIGKNGISKDKTEVIIVDWRAPVTALYYENELGSGSYEVPGVGSIDVDLQKKRTFDINNGKLLGYYDNDAAASDELLVKYLSQNKDAVLGDIISTIQKEQNRIIRQLPYRNIIVQGVAGSGKTTVAMHRISHILYNYEHRFTPDVFCIIGSNDMLLNYITSGLPELDVQNVKQKRMDKFFTDILGREWKKQYQLEDIKVSEAFKSHISYGKDLDDYLYQIRMESLCKKEVKDDQIGVILSLESINTTVAENPRFSLTQLYKLLNERIRKRIKFLLSDDDSTYCRQKTKEYSGYFKPLATEKDIVKIYLQFLKEYEKQSEKNTASVQEKVEKGIFDVYDLAALTLIQKRITAKKALDEFEQIFVDEAQDFGALVYYVLKQVLKDCYFTIMGDVSQNIHYETGMNHWDDLKDEVFESKNTEFEILAKSYRNTIEISEYAGKILEKASFGQYKIEPVIRHGETVGFHKIHENDMVKTVLNLIEEIQARSYGTIAVICRDFKTSEWLKQKLSGLIEIDYGSDFQKGVMILPIELTKGLEFDGVILWNPNSTNYPECEAEAKLLYVAVTRALHELHVVYNRELSSLLL